jgi:exodeoxyribonuclease VII large subunit
VASPDTQRPDGIDGSTLPGPYPVGSYAAQLKARLREFRKVQVFGEVWNLGGSRAKVYFELRDERGALPCSMWRTDFEALGLAEGALADGAQVVLAGGTDYYEGSRTSSPSFTFLAKSLRIAGEGDLLAQLDRLRKRLDGEGLFAPQKLLRRPALPRTIGVVTGETGKARGDVLAGLRRRGWEGRLVWAFAPVQDRRAAPAITAALQDLAARGGVDTIVVARGGGSLADLFAFCDETLCRTVALLPVPVIASVGHHSDRTLIDDVAAVACSTPTHAAEQAVRIHCGEARAEMAVSGARLRDGANRAVLLRARRLTELTRAPAEHVARERRRLHQQLRELRAAGRRMAESRRAPLHQQARELRAAGTRRVTGDREASLREARTLERKTAAAARSASPAGDRRRELDRLLLALAAHDPERTLERGYALVSDDEGELVTSAEAARRAGRLSVRFRDDAVRTTVEDDQP